MNDKLTLKREKKLKELQTHVERTAKFVSKKKEPPRRNNNNWNNHYRRYPNQHQQRHPRNPRLRNQQSQQPPPRQSTTYASVTRNPNQYLQPQASTHQVPEDQQIQPSNYQVSGDQHLVELITSIVKNIITQIPSQLLANKGQN